MLRVPAVSLFLGCCLLTLTAVAENEGLEDLDKATELQLSARSLDDLEKVADLCESALKKGLDEGNQQFARQLLTATLYQHASRLTAPIFDQKAPNPRWPLLRQFAVRDLDRLLKHDGKFGAAWLLKARLLALPGGNAKEAARSAEKATRFIKDDPPALAQAHILKAQLTQDVDEQLKHLNAAVKADPSNVDGWKLRALVFMARGDFQDAIDDFNRLIKEDENNIAVRLAVAEALSNLKKYDAALEQIDKTLEIKSDSAMSYSLRARIFSMMEKPDRALADITEAIRLEPRDPASLLFRARLYLTENNPEKARADIDRALEVRPGLTQAMLLRGVLNAGTGDFDQAIRDMEAVVRVNPNNPNLIMQLGRYYAASKRPRKAVEVFTQAVKQDKENWEALRARADTLLSIGKHAAAVADYDKALKMSPEHSGILNNLAWVLATSPKDGVRNGERSVELGKKACEVTEFSKPHILSTLAAGYAEAGDFESAIKWSSKAVELGEKDLEEQLDQLKQELESYRKGKPWRELQEVEEAPDVLEQPADTFDT